MTSYRLGNVWFKAIPAYLFAFGTFWFGNLGTRMFKEILVIRWIKNFRKISWVEVFFASVIAGGLLFPMFFLQSGTPWNTIQFTYYSLMLSGILAGVWLGEVIENSKLKSKMVYIIVVAIVLLTIPTTIGTLWYHYLPPRPPAKISNEELEALKFLSKQPEGVTLTYPFDKAKAEEAKANPPRPLYLYESTAYVSAFANKSVFLEDEVNLDITGYNWRDRRKAVEDFLNTLEEKDAWTFLRDNNISYIYWIKGQRAKLGETQLGIERIFENKEVDIYKVI